MISDSFDNTAAQNKSVQMRSDMLSRTPWANDFSAAELDALAAFMETREIGKGSVLFVEGDQTDQMYLVIAGSVNVLKGAPDHAVKFLATLGPGKTFGEMALIDAEPRSASVVTNADTTFLVLTAAGFDALTAQHPGVALSFVRKLARMLSERLRETSGALCEYLNPITP